MVAFGFLGMLVALAWFAQGIIRALVGPNRGKALGRVGIATLAFFGSAVLAGWNLAPSRSAGLSSSSSAAVQQPAAVPAAMLPIDVFPSEQATKITIVSRYQTSSTLVSLVVAGVAQGNQEQLSDFARAECGSADFCSVGIWSDDSLAPRKLKMTAKQQAGRLGQYVHSRKTGIDHLLWNCEQWPHAADECLP